MDKRAFILPLLDLASTNLEITPAVFDLTGPLLRDGVESFDAPFISRTANLQASIFLTVDDRRIRRFARRADPRRLQVLNPIDWIAWRKHAS